MNIIGEKLSNGKPIEIENNQTFNIQQIFVLFDPSENVKFFETCFKMNNSFLTIRNKRKGIATLFGSLRPWIVSKGYFSKEYFIPYLAAIYESGIYNRWKDTVESRSHFNAVKDSVKKSLVNIKGDSLKYVASQTIQRSNNISTPVKALSVFDILIALLFNFTLALICSLAFITERIYCKCVVAQFIEKI